MVSLHVHIESVLVEWTKRFIRFNTPILAEDELVPQQAALFLAGASTLALVAEPTEIYLQQSLI